MSPPDFSPTPHPEMERRSQLIRIFGDLSRPETAGQVTVETLLESRQLLRDELIEVGVNFEVLSTPEMQHKLQSYKFRGDSPKRMAILAGTPPTFLDRFSVWVGEISDDLPDLEFGDKDSSNRGSLQILANTIAFAAGAIDGAAYLQDLKYRIGAYYERPLFDQMKSLKRGDPEKESFRIKLRPVRTAYSIPSPLDKDNPGYEERRLERKWYSEHHRTSPAFLEGFWPNLNQIMRAK